jgi:putative restriction endonuclease
MRQGVHLLIRAGISGSQVDGADSIVISGGYGDDTAFGDEVIYTGHGGQDVNGKQVADQMLTFGNIVLL